MSSEVQICNIALSNIRAGSINSLNEGSLQAQVCKLKYDILRDRCLREIPWQFNHKIEPLAPVTTELFNWGSAYSYPNDCLKIRRLISSTEGVSVDRRQIPYEVFNVDDRRVIGSNQSNLLVEFAAKVTDPNLFSDDFMMALAHLLSSELAVPIVGAELGRALRNDSLQLYQQYLKSAIATDQNDQYLANQESEFITIRN